MENPNAFIKTGKSSILEIEGMRYIACTLNGVSTLGILMGLSFSGLSIVAFPRSLTTNSNFCTILAMSKDTFINLDQPIYVGCFAAVSAHRVYYDALQEAVIKSPIFNQLEVNKYVWMDESAVCQFINTN